jgi:glycosyltransferase involved in cell wall biosynthesis
MDDGGCGHYRMIWVAEELARQGHDVHVFWDPGAKLFQAGYGVGDIPVSIKTTHDLVHDCDVLILQRVVKRELAQLIPLIQGLGIAVVVDFDDDFTCVPKRNIGYAEFQPENNPDKNYQWALIAAETADFVTVSTPALARRFAPHGRVAVLPNCVPESYLGEPMQRLVRGTAWNPSLKLRIGWSGNVHTHPGDVEVTAGAAQRVADRFPGRIEIAVVGNGEGARDALGLADETKLIVTGYKYLKNWPRHVARLDVGMVPLQRSAFNRAKSWLKGLEMAAVGVPFVASPTPEYERLARLGAGVLAAKPSDWDRELGRLADDPGLRRERVAQGLEVAKTLTIEGNAHRWLLAWSEARAMRMAA